MVNEISKTNSTSSSIESFREIIKDTTTYENESIGRAVSFFGVLHRSDSPDSFILLVHKSGLEYLLQINLNDVLKHEIISENASGKKIVKVFVSDDSNIKIITQLPSISAMRFLRSNRKYSYENDDNSGEEEDPIPYPETPGEVIPIPVYPDYPEYPGTFPKPEPIPVYPDPVFPPPPDQTFAREMAPYSHYLYHPKNHSISRRVANKRKQYRRWYRYWSKYSPYF